MAENAPPGRARRLWLLERLERARRSLDLLDRKRRVLLAARQELDGRRAAAGAERESAWAEARRAMLRASALAGATQVTVAAAAVAGRATAETSWGHTAGVRCPDAVRCELPALPPLRTASVSAAVLPAAAAHRRALDAVAAHAAAEASYRLVDAELRATERRHRAIDRHRIPALEAELAALLLRLDELEREERVAARWARLT